MNWMIHNDVSGLPDFSWKNSPKRKKHSKRQQNLPHGHKIYQMALILQMA
jgi:hypothetical protein